MSKKKRNLESLIRNAPQTNQRSAYVAAIRELVWAEKTPAPSLYAKQVMHASRILLTHPDLRVVKFPKSQAAAFLDFGDDLVRAAADARPPFGYTFYDFGFQRLANYEIVAAVVYWDDTLDGWQGIAYLRVAGTDDWTDLFFSSEQWGKGLPFKSEVIAVDGSRQGRPDSPDDGFLASLVCAGALVFLESANVDLVDAVPLPKGHRAFGIPHHEVVIRQQKRRLIYPEDHAPDSPDWSHRWEVRGHFKHFRTGPTFEKNPDRRIAGVDGDQFVRIWCPPHVKGPEDKPLIPKLRRVAA
jgi:hypothetical protein